MRRAALLAILAAPMACQVYTPLDPAVSPIGEPVRVTLTDLGRVHLTGTVGPSAHLLDGRVTSASDSSITVAVTSLERESGVEENWSGEQVTIARADIAQAERQRTAVGRSLVAAAGLLGGVIVAGRVVGGSAVGGSSGGTKGRGN